VAKGKKKQKPKPKPEVTVLCRNKKARFNYFIDETLEAGIALLGSEVKSAKEGRVSLAEAYVILTDGEAFLTGAHIAEWPYSHQRNHEPTRRRKLLLHKKEIKRLYGKTQEKGYTLVPIVMYIRRGKIKVEVGLARGKRKYDKRETIRKKDEKREQEQTRTR
jgi:SsrA-binding protein